MSLGKTSHRFAHHSRFALPIKSPLQMKYLDNSDEGRVLAEENSCPAQYPLLLFYNVCMGSRDTKSGIQIVEIYEQRSKVREINVLCSEDICQPRSFRRCFGNAG